MNSFVRVCSNLVRTPLGITFGFAVSGDNYRQRRLHALLALRPRLGLSGKLANEAHRSLGHRSLRDFCSFLFAAYLDPLPLPVRNIGILRPPCTRQNSFTQRE